MRVMMTRQQRAKQFQPFDAMKGLQEALRDREERHSRVERHGVSDEMIEENSEVLRKLLPGMTVVIEHYHAFHDITTRGKVSKVDVIYRFLIVNGIKIYFDDLYTIQIIEF